MTRRHKGSFEFQVSSFKWAKGQKLRAKSEKRRAKMANSKTVLIKIKRQDTPEVETVLGGV